MCRGWIVCVHVFVLCVCVCVCVRRGRVVQPPLCDPWFSSYGLAIVWHWTDGLVPHPLWFLFTWLRCLVSSSIFKYRTEATWISSRRAQKRIVSCNVCTLGLLSDRSAQLLTLCTCVSCVLMRILHVYLFECLVAWVLGCCMFVCAYGCVQVLLLDCPNLWHLLNSQRTGAQ